MKTKTFGTTSYLVETYYTDKDGKLKTFCMRFLKPQVAKSFVERYKAHIGEKYSGLGFEGTIVDCFVFKTKQCKIEE